MMLKFNEDDLPKWNIEPKIRLIPLPDPKVLKKVETVWEFRKEQLIRHRYYTKKSKNPITPIK